MGAWKQGGVKVGSAAELGWEGGRVEVETEMDEAEKEGGNKKSVCGGLTQDQELGGGCRQKHFVREGIWVGGGGFQTGFSALQPSQVLGCSLPGHTVADLKITILQGEKLQKDCIPPKC